MLEGSREVVTSTLGSETPALKYSESIPSEGSECAASSSAICRCSSSASFRSSVGTALPSSKASRSLRLRSAVTRSLASTDFW